MTLDESIKELEAGFEHLVAGLRATLHELREENAILKARLDERRLMAGSVATSTIPPAGVIPFADIVAAQPGRPSTPKSTSKSTTYEHVCAGCHVPYVSTMKHSRVCPPCVTVERSARMSERWAAIKAGRVPRPKMAGARVDQRLLDEVDMRIAVAR